MAMIIQGKINVQGSWSSSQGSGHCQAQQSRLPILSASGESEHERQLTRNVLVTTEGSNDSSLVGENDLVVGVGREETLEEGDSRVEDDGALGTSLDADLDFVVVDDVAADTRDVGRGPAVEVGGAKEVAELEGVGLARVISVCAASVKGKLVREKMSYLAEGSSLGVRASVGIGVLVVAVAVTVPGDDNDTEDF